MLPVNVCGKILENAYRAPIQPVRPVKPVKWPVKPVFLLVTVFMRLLISDT